MRLAAIDIGSNAVRLLISEVIREADGSLEFNKLNLVRVPLRLGIDVFQHGFISQTRTDMMLQTMCAYKHLMNAYQVEGLKACATSAMRDAKNSVSIIEQVKEKTGIEIEIISGQQEASILYENHIAENLDKTRTYLYIDVGGGSTEITLFSKNQMLFKESFNIGTIRLLNNQVTEAQWTALKDFIKNNIKTTAQPLVAIGSGGNINKVFSLSKRKEGKPLTLQLLKDYHKELSSVSLHDRIHLYKLREDRADVIVPALLIYINIMRWTNTEEIYVPKIGVADGLIRILYNELKG